MVRILIGLLLATGWPAARAAVPFETAADVYLAAAVRDQIRPSLATMPAHVRQMFASDGSALSPEQLGALDTAAKRSFRIDVFEPSAIAAFAKGLDAASAAKAATFLESDIGRRMVADDVALAALPEATIDQVMDGSLAAPSTPQRDALVERLERAAQSTESTVRVFIGLGEAVAAGTAVGSGLDPAAVGRRAHASGEAGRAELEAKLRVSMRRMLAYGYRDMSDADLKRLLAFLESPAGKRYVEAYDAAMGAGFDAMGRRCGERLGESLRELAMAKADARAIGMPGDAGAAPAAPPAPTGAEPPPTPGLPPTTTPPSQP